MDSVPGLYRHVLVLDFKSLYPSIIRTFKIDPMGLAHSRLVEDDSALIPGFNGAVFSKHKTILPHIVPIITSYKIKKESKKLLGEVSDLYGWYYSLVEDVNVEAPDAELVTLVNKITANKTTELEKVKAIYYWTQKNIKYIAFEYALGGFIPRESNEVFRKKYGDCKDNSSILYRMLEVAGVKGNLTWIGTRKIPYTYKEVPTPVVDNHMILSYENNGRTYYLDATGRYIKFGIPTSFIQGKEALVSYGKNFKIKNVPVVDAKINAIIDATTIKIENGSVIGKAKTVVAGYPKIDFFHDLENENTQTKLKQFYNSMFEKGNNKFLVSSFKETNKYDYDKDFIVDYDFEIKNYAKKLGDEIGVITCTYEGFIENEQGKFKESNIKLKKLLPVFKKAHPVYLDALSTIAENYLELDIIDSAFVYVNKMPLEDIDNINNLNYSLHKYYVSFLYNLEKDNIESAIAFNNKIGKHRISTEHEIFYFKNALDIAKKQKDSNLIIQYSDSLEKIYEKRVKEVKKEDVYTSENALRNNKNLLTSQKEVKKQKLYLTLSIISLIIVVAFISFFFMKKKRRQDALINNMKNELEILTKNLATASSDEETKEPKESFEEKIKSICAKYNLSDREADILQHIVYGYKNTEIADKLFISVNTVKYHIKNLYEKLEVQKRTEISSKIIFDK